MQVVGFCLDSFLMFSFWQLNSSPAFLSTFWEVWNRDLVDRDTDQLADREVLMVAIFRVKYLQALECHTLPSVVVVHACGSTTTLHQDCKYTFWPFMHILGKIYVLFDVYACVFFKF